jgi:hypothetical protein
VVSESFSVTSATSSPADVDASSPLVARALAKLTAGRMFAGGGTRGEPDLLVVRSNPPFEPDRDMVCCCTLDATASRSFSTRSVISLSRAETSTGLEEASSGTEQRKIATSSHLASPKGFERGVLVPALAGPIRGDDSGDGTADGPLRGRSSSLRRPIWGVGGVEVVAIMAWRKFSKQLQSG